MKIPVHQTHTRTRRNYAILAFGAGLLVASAAVRADAEVTFHGTLIELPPCEISGKNGDAIDVNFGDEIITRKIDGKAYKEEIPFTLDCTNAVNQKLKLTLSGEAGYAAGLLKTSKSDLGIRLYHTDTQMMPGLAINFTPDTVPKLYAVLEAKDNTTLTGGRFDSSANMIVEYQ